MKKVYYLSTCDTCKKIMAGLNLDDFDLQDIKSKPLTIDQLEKLKELSGSYLSLFSKRAQLYKKLNLKEKILTEEDMKSLLLEHYTFLKRPVVVNHNDIYIGSTHNSKDALLKDFGK